MKCFDLQVNGITDLAAQVHCDFWQSPSDEEINRALDYLRDAGLGGILATLITAPFAEISAALERIQNYVEHYPASLIKGVHIEGGYISQEGIHPREYLSELSPQKVLDLLDRFPALIKMFTLCPQVDHDAALTTMLQAHGVKVAYGHSLADYDLVEKCFDRYGVNLVTHWPNAMILVRDLNDPSRFDHRNPSTEFLKFLQLDRDTALSFAQAEGLNLGLGFSAYHREDIYLTVIAGSTENKDLHVHPEILQLLAKKKSDKLILVSDQVAFSDLELDEQKILALRGGRVPLTRHLENARDFGWDSKLIKQAACTNPMALLR